MSNLGHKLKTAKLVLKKPRVTEKATLVTTNKYPVYTFEIPFDVGKIEVKRAVEERFKVTPIKVRIVNLPPKKTSFRRTAGVKSGVKKALVYLPEGQTIDTI